MSDSDSDPPNFDWDSDTTWGQQEREEYNQRQRKKMAEKMRNDPVARAKAAEEAKKALEKAARAKTPAILKKYLGSEDVSDETIARAIVLINKSCDEALANEARSQWLDKQMQYQYEQKQCKEEEELLNCMKRLL
jgi:hypothetical protein